MLKLVCLTLFVAAVSAVTPYSDCGHKEVTSFEINGCTTSPCVFHKGKSFETTIEFTANQDSTTIKLTLHAIVNGTDWDLTKLLPGIETDGCKLTPCPIKKGVSQKFVQKVNIPTGNPSLKADVKGRLIGQHDDIVCTIFQVDIQD